MADNKPKKGAGSDNPSSKPGGRQNPLVCAEWEAMLVDALDGTLSTKDTAAFEAHRATCTACAQLMDEARRGGEWLQFLETEPEIPSDLVARILASTSGTADSMQAVPVIAGVPLVVAQPGWLPGLERHAVQSRWIMTAAMAFFSIAFTLNLTGVRIAGFHLSDLAPSNLATNLKRQFYVADAGVIRYYDNLRFVYELESRVREMKRDVAPSESRSDGTGNGQRTTTPAPATAPGNQPEQKKPGSGSAQKGSPGRPTPSAEPSDPLGEELRPVLASFHPGKFNRPCDAPASKEVDITDVLQPAPKKQIETDTKETCSSKTYGTKKDRAERSLA
jgi:hypothetical protein